jgi:glycogen synthase
MRILITTDTIGGVWTWARELATGLLLNGCSVALASFGRIPNSAQLDWVTDQVARWESRFRFVASDVPLEWMRDNYLAMSDGKRLLQRLAREFRSDVLIGSQFCFGALDCDLPRIVVAHSDVLSWAQACGRHLPDSDWLARYRSLVAAGLRGADAVIAPTQWMLDALAANFELPAETRVIANGRTLPPDEIRSERNMQAVTAGRLWDEGKNLKLLASIDPPMPLLVAGELEHESSHLNGVCGKAVLLGPLDEEEMLAFLRQSSIYICTSQYEPFGLAPLEAALCGCAILSNDIPSLREVWGDAALFFSDAESLSSLLTALCADRRLLERARLLARRRARQLTAKRMAEGYFEFLQGIMQPVMAERYVG